MENCRSPCAEVTARLNAVTTSNSISLSLFCDLFDLFLHSLLDSGSTHSFIDENFVKKHDLPTFSVPPILLHLIDGTMCPPITSATKITARFPCGTTHSVRFYITQLDSKFLTVLGLDWLTQRNPLIDWVDQSVTFHVRPDPTPISAPAMASVDMT